MKYVCNECGKILDEQDVIINPDKDANCISCYDKTKFFDEEEDNNNLHVNDDEQSFAYKMSKEKKSHWWDL